MPKKKATLNSQYWKSFFSSIKNCYQCGFELERVYVKAEKSRRHVCVSCRNITYLNPKIVAGVIPVDSKGRVLLLTRGIEPAYGYWSFPAGFQEMGETVEKAAAREAVEETRARVKIGGLVGIYSYPDAGVVTIVYEGKVSAKEKPGPTEESLSVEFFDPKKIPWKKLAFRSTHDALKDWAKKNKKR